MHDGFDPAPYSRAPRCGVCVSCMACREVIDEFDRTWSPPRWIDEGIHKADLNYDLDEGESLSYWLQISKNCWRHEFRRYVMDVELDYPCDAKHLLASPVVVKVTKPAKPVIVEKPPIDPNDATAIRFSLLEFD